MVAIYKDDVIYDSIACPMCHEHHCTILSPSHPTIYRCLDCHHDWNPDNLPPAIVQAQLAARDEHLLHGVPNYQNAADTTPLDNESYSTIEQHTGIWDV